MQTPKSKIFPKMAAREENRVFVGGLSWDTTEIHLEDAFSQYGKILKSLVMRDRDTGRPRGFGFITFADHWAMEDALREMHGRELDGRVISVDKLEPKMGGDYLGYGYSLETSDHISSGKNTWGKNTPVRGSDCFRCGCSGHFARECPSRGGGGHGDCFVKDCYVDCYDGRYYGDGNRVDRDSRNRSHNRYSNDRYLPGEHFAGDPCMDRDPQGYGKGGDYNGEVGPRGDSDRYGSKGPAHHDRGSYKDMPSPCPRMGGVPPSYDGPGSLEVPSKSSPATPRTARQLKTPGSGSDSISTSPLPPSRTPKDRSPKVIERRSPRSPVTEKKRPSKVSELESQLTRLQDDFKKAKDQLGSSESWKRRAQQEAEESKKQVLSMSAKLEESQQQLLELSASEEARVQELRKISQDRDRAWESELEAVQKQHCMDSAALASAMNEIQKLKKQLGMVAESEAAHTKHAESAHSDIQSLQVELSETLFLVEKMNTELSYCKESEASALEVLSKTSLRLESAKATADTLRSEGLKVTEAYNSLALELEQSKARVNSLEGLVSKLQADVVGSGSKSSVDPSAGIVQVAHGTEENEETKQLKAELNHLKFEVGKLRSALDAAEIRYQEEYIQSTLQIRSAYEQVDRTKSESCLREAELEAELKKAKDNIEELKEKLMDNETKLQSISMENEGLNLKIERNQSSDEESKLEMEVKKSEADLADLKANFMDKESEFQSITEENEMLKLQIQKREMEKNKTTDEAIDLAAAARAAEQEARMKLGYLTEEAEKNSRRAARVTEQLDAAQAANSEMEAELRRLKVQSDQWRKAAEAAAAMLSTGNNGKYIERPGSLDNNYHSIGAKMGSPFSDDMDDDSPKKKNGNMLKKIGVLWKKGQK